MGQGCQELWGRRGLAGSLVSPLSCWQNQGQAGQGVEAAAVTQDSPVGRAGPAGVDRGGHHSQGGAWTRQVAPESLPLTGEAPAQLCLHQHVVSPWPPSPNLLLRRMPATGSGATLTECTLTFMSAKTLVPIRSRSRVRGQDLHSFSFLLKIF